MNEYNYRLKREGSKSIVFDFNLWNRDNDIELC